MNLATFVKIERYPNNSSRRLFWLSKPLLSYQFIWVCIEKAASETAVSLTSIVGTDCKGSDLGKTLATYPNIATFPYALRKLGYEVNRNFFVE